MEFGMFTDFHIRQGMNEAEAFEESFNQVDAAEQMGMDSVWLAEHHFSPDRAILASPLTIASAIAARTSRIRIGLAVQVLPLANPLRVAEEAATVDHISKGRLDFGIGRSGLTKYYQGYNIDYAESRSRFFESLEIILKAWGEEQFSHQGEYYTFNDVNVVPKPYQNPHPPIRIAVTSADTFAIVGRMAHSIFIMQGVPQLQERLKEYRKARQEAGHPGPADVMLRIPAYVAETSERAHSEPMASTMHGIQYAARELGPSAASQETAERIQRLVNTPYEEILRERVMYGTPEAVVDRLHEYKEQLGLSGVILEVNFGGQIPADRVINCIRLLTEKVVPKFK